ncbi:putative ADP-ribosylation factor GTPase-activating protein AGD15 [Diplonema papillatum]|nr:putative ADP-ribosylation factor GTPase-activating protein AGD15 [Diplonema papillatum]
MPVISVPDDAGHDELQEALKTICGYPCNSECMDCDGRAPKWAVVNWGIFVCIRCSGIHRNLGTHISKVKSVNLDKWTVEEVRWISKMGNVKAQEVLEARPKKSFPKPTDTTPTSDVSEYIKAKYARLEMASKTKKPPTLKAWLKREQRRKEGRPSRKKEKKEDKDRDVDEESSDGSDSPLDSSSNSPSPITPSRGKGVFGDVTGDPSTLEKRKNELLSLFE